MALAIKLIHSFKISIPIRWKSFSTRRTGLSKHKTSFQKKVDGNSKVQTHSETSRFSKSKLKQDLSEGSQDTDSRSLFKLTMFVSSFSGACFVGSCIWHYERFRTRLEERRKRRFSGQNQSKTPEIRNQLRTLWGKISYGEKAAIVITYACLVVFICWRTIPNRLLIRHFMNGYQLSHSYASTVLSAFSHYNFTHFALNMYVLWQIAPPVVNRFLGVEQFTGFYLAAAAVSSYASVLSKLATKSKAVSLGASGAILALLMYSCQKNPHGSLHIVFLPMFPFSAESAMWGILAFDLVGLLFLPKKWQYFDHAAHLGGSLFGLWYAKYGENLLWKRYKFYVIRFWISLKGRH